MYMTLYTLKIILCINLLTFFSLNPFLFSDISNVTVSGIFLHRELTSGDDIESSHLFYPDYIIAATAFSLGTSPII